VSTLINKRILTSSDQETSLLTYDRWYRNSAYCLAFLSDVESRDTCYDSRWFTRGWTLQELIAPPKLIFLNKSWEIIGDKYSLGPHIERATKIPPDVVISRDAVFEYSVAQRLSWAAKRETTRIEDQSYCLLGILDINMPLLYGEGDRAFQRLQQEIVKVTDDHTIYAWKADSCSRAVWRSLFAKSPSEFAEAGSLRPSWKTPAFHDIREEHETTVNTRIKIELLLAKRSLFKKDEVEKDVNYDKWEWVSLLDVQDKQTGAVVGIYLREFLNGEYVRVDPSHLFSMSRIEKQPFFKLKIVSVRQRLDYSPWHSCNSGSRLSAIRVNLGPHWWTKMLQLDQTAMAKRRSVQEFCLSVSYLRTSQKSSPNDGTNVGNDLFVKYNPGTSLMVAETAAMDAETAAMERYQGKSRIFINDQQGHVRVLPNGQVIGVLKVYLNEIWTKMGEGLESMERESMGRERMEPETE
jgi:hypothetical protein